MASTATLPPSDILTPRLPAHPMAGMYHPSSRSPAIRNDRPQDYGHHGQPHQYPRDHPSSRDPMAGRPRENVRYEPYPDRRRTVSGRDPRDEKIVLPPPSLAGLRLPDDPYAPRHVLPSIQQNPSSWSGNDNQQRAPSRGSVQLPSIRSISGDSSPATRIAPLTTATQYDRPAPSPRDPYRPAISPRPPYSQPTPPPHPYDAHHSQHRPAPYPYPQTAAPPPPVRKTHPPPIRTHHSPPMQVKYEPDPSPPLRTAPLPVTRVGESPFYSTSTPPRYSPSGQQGPEYNETRRGSVVSLAGEGKEQVVGQTRRLAHLMSEQKRRESINSGFTALRSALPLALPTDSKAVILRKALARIEQLERAAGIPSHPRTHGYLHSQAMHDSETSTHSSRTDWRSGGTLHPARMDDRTSHSSSSSRHMREMEIVGGGRYEDEWAEPRREIGKYNASPLSEREDAGYGIPIAQPAGERVGGGQEVESGWNQEEEDDMDAGSVYSQDRAPSRQSQSHVR